MKISNTLLFTFIILLSSNAAFAKWKIFKKKDHFEYVKHKPIKKKIVEKPTESTLEISKSNIEPKAETIDNSETAVQANAPVTTFINTDIENISTAKSFAKSNILSKHILKAKRKAKSKPFIDETELQNKINNTKNKMQAQRQKSIDERTYIKEQLAAASPDAAKAYKYAITGFVLLFCGLVFSPCLIAAIIFAFLAFDLSKNLYKEEKIAFVARIIAKATLYAAISLIAFLILFMIMYILLLLAAVNGGVII